MHCGKCGTQNTEENNFCKMCGVAIKEIPSIAPVKTEQSHSVEPTALGMSAQVWLGVTIMLGLAMAYEWIRIDSHQVSLFVKYSLTGAYLISVISAAYQVERTRACSVGKVLLRIAGITVSLAAFGCSFLIISLGFISCLSLIGLLWGIPLIFLGLFVASPGLTLCLPSKVLSQMDSHAFKNVSCPYCGNIRKVLREDVSFKCGGCKQRVLIKEGVGVKLACR